MKNKKDVLAGSRTEEQRDNLHAAPGKEHTLLAQRLKDFSRLVNKLMQEHGPEARVEFKSDAYGRILAVIAAQTKP